MKIAFIYDVIYPWVKGGVEKRIWELSVRLSARGHDVHIVGMKYWDGPDSLIKDGVTLHGICPPLPLYADGRRTIGEAIRFSMHLVPFLMREEFDIVDCQQFPYFPCFTAKIATKLKKRPLVITWHEVWGDYWYEYLGWKGIFGKITERIVAGLTPHTISVSGTTAEKLRHLGGLPEPCIIPNGINPEQITSVLPSPEPSDIIFVGRLIKEKHVDVLVRAFAMLNSESSDLTLLLVGDGPEREPLRILIRDLAVEDRVVLKPFLDSHDDVIGLMQSSHVFVIPSTREGFGIAALEALACGLPVVTVNHPDNAICELITKNNGFLSTLSVHDLADTIKAALVRYPVMKSACISSAEFYDWTTIAGHLEKYYREVAIP